MDGEYDIFMGDQVVGTARVTFRFRVLPRHSAMQEKFICVYPEEPFAYLSRLKEAYLQERRGQLGIVIPASE